MKLALVADQLLACAGAEKTFAVMCQAFPGAHIYTTIYDPVHAPQEFRQYAIRQLLSGPCFRDVNSLRKNFPLALAALQKFSFSGYDVVLSSAAHIGRFIRKGSAFHLSYTYCPFRLLYEPHLYPQISGLRGAAFLLGLPFLRAWDRSKARQVDRFLSISRDSQNAILRCYGSASKIISPPVLNMPDVYIPSKKEEFYLMVSRFEPWKNLDMVITTFRNLDRKLMIVGEGPQEAALRRLAGSNVKFLGKVDEAALSQLYRACRALIHPTATEYGLTPIEANAHGSPAICLGVKGVLDTMISYQSDPERATAWFYDKSEPAALRQAILDFEQVQMDGLVCFRHAQQYSPRIFRERLQREVQQISHS